MISDDSLDYVDDSTILDHADLWRRIPPWHIIEDKNLGGKRISSAAFSDHDDGSPMSVVLGRDILLVERTPQSVIEGYDAYCLASVTAGFARSLAQGVVRRPLKEEPAHAEVFGNKTKSVRRKFAHAAAWIIGPEAGYD